MGRIPANCASIWHAASLLRCDSVPTHTTTRLRVQHVRGAGAGCARHMGEAPHYSTRRSHLYLAHVLHSCDLLHQPQAARVVVVSSLCTAGMVPLAQFVKGRVGDAIAALDGQLNDDRLHGKQTDRRHPGGTESRVVSCAPWDSPSGCCCSLFTVAPACAAQKTPTHTMSYPHQPQLTVEVGHAPHPSGLMFIHGSCWPGKSTPHTPAKGCRVHQV